jgi:hypothetical protein
MPLNSVIPALIWVPLGITLDSFVALWENTEKQDIRVT